MIEQPDSGPDRRSAVASAVRYAAVADVCEIHRVLAGAFSPLLQQYTSAARPLVVPTVDVIRLRLE